MELSDDERLLLVDRVSELATLNEDQLSILSDKAMNCHRGDEDFRKIQTLGTFWRRHREGLVSLANFTKQVNKACGLPEQPPQPQPECQNGGAPIGGSPIPSGGASSGGGGGKSSGGGDGVAAGGGSASARGVSAGEEEDVEDDVTVLELDQNGAGDIGENDDDDDDDDDDGGGGGGGGVDDDDDNDDVAEAIKKIVDQHIEGGFFEPRRWKSSRTLVRPGDGYWKDDHRIQEFRTSTVADLKKATPRPAPTYITRNPFCAAVPKRFFDYNMEMYFLCKKVAVSSDGEIFRATDKEIMAALKKQSRAPAGIASADMYVKAVREARRRHLVAEGEEEEEDEEEEDEEEEEEEEEQDEEIEDDVTEVELDQNGGGDSDGSDEEEAEEGGERVGRAVKKIVDQHAEDGFLARQRWRRTMPFTRPGEGYWREDHDTHRVKLFRDATAADLKAAKPRPAPVYISNNPLCAKQPKQKYKKQLGMYYLCRKVAVSFDGKIFRATNKDIAAALKEATDVPAGLSAGMYLKAVREMHRRNDQGHEKQEEEEEEEEDEDEEENDNDRAAETSPQGKRRRVDVAS